MSTTTVEGRLAEVQRRIDRLRTLARGDAAAERSRIERHLHALHQEEGSIAAAARSAPDEVEERLGRLQMRLAVAESSLVADASHEWPAFAAAVEDELRGWDTYLERLQATTATKALKTREWAEVAIADVRTRRIAVDDALARAREELNGVCREQRNHVGTARDELERKADELSTKLN